MSVQSHVKTPITKPLTTTKPSTTPTVQTQTTLSPNNNVSIMSKSTPMISSKHTTSPTTTTHTKEPKSKSVHDDMNVQESKSNDVSQTKVKVHPSISSDMKANMDSLEFDVKMSGFHGPNCHNASLMALGLEYTLFDNGDTLINSFVEKFTTTTDQKGVTKDLKAPPKDLKPGDIFVIKSTQDDSTVHTFTYKGDDQFFQKNNQDPGNYYTSDLKGALAGWLKPGAGDFEYTYEVVRPDLGKLTAKESTVSQTLDAVKNMEKSFGQSVEIAWNESKEFMSKVPELSSFSKNFYPTDKAISSLVAMKSQLDELGKTLEEALAKKDDLDSSDQNLLSFAKDRYDAMKSQLNNIVSTMNEPVNETPKNDKQMKKAWRTALRFVSVTANNW